MVLILVFFTAIPDARDNGSKDGEAKGDVADGDDYKGAREGCVIAISSCQVILMGGLSTIDVVASNNQPAS